ncbi:spermine oxidase [Biomphalaria pfeifferi]|uniref:Spermine oxidase n=1 Tax=Biomphalaria pfeifferi TaxID=112525 RepID=A0AAD8BPF7_BIOPF|nr:spermine oxidase [Biomphalaria pfeifferi]
MAESMRHRQPKIVIIGAGLAGVAAGKYLISEGFSDFVILEASDRIGGRIWSIPVDNNGHKVEMGANWIHGIKDNPIYKLADENNLLTERELHLNSKNIYLTESGEAIHEGTVKKVDFAYGTMLSSCEEYFHTDPLSVDDHESLGGELDNLMEERLRNTAGEERHMLELVYHQRRLLECCICGCHDLNEVSLSQFGSYRELPGRHLVIPRGFCAILDIVKNGIPEDKIKLNTPVTKICYGDSEVEPGYPSPDGMVTVKCDNGDVYYADHVIVTVSLGVMKSLCDKMFSPALPARKLDAIRRMGFGVVNKVILVFDEPVLPQPIHRLHLAWDPAILSNENLAERWFRKIYSLEVVHDNVLVGWLSGREAMYLESMSEEDLMRDMNRLVEMFVRTQRDTIPKLTRVIRTSWSSNKFTKGSYSFMLLGSSQEDIYSLMSPITKNLEDGNKKPVVLFAGEATHPEFYSTTHGALLTGNREAERIIQFWRPNEETRMRFPELCLNFSDAESTEEHSDDDDDDEGLCFM